VQQAIWKKRPGKLSKIIILQHDFTHPHTANMMKAILAATAWEIMNYLSYSPDLAPVFPFVWTNEDTSRRTEISI
jgi:hypothetical protein